ncbi:hypothetical protein ACFUN7_28485 [Streptomyces sp. NPDC057236]|uniref:hypothetical protein n=1 Tax=Streptomyces sp. NPDC057236 TaxID=3346059 RepID=UPI0036416DF4
MVRTRVADGSTARWLERTGRDLVLAKENRDTRRGAYLIQLDQTTLRAPASRRGAHGTVLGASPPVRELQTTSDIVQAFARIP